MEKKWCGGEIPSRQKMFDLAVNGLANQQWKKSSDGWYGPCLYENTSGLKCAWGHVDVLLDKNDNNMGSVADLHRSQFATYSTNGEPTLAYFLDSFDIEFAAQLQMAHDSSVSSEDMNSKFKGLCAKFNLVWPLKD
jgi:hypothetical protein